MSKESFTAEEARQVGTEIGIDWDTAPFDVEQFRMGMDVELEHGLHDLATNVTDSDPTKSITSSISCSPVRKNSSASHFPPRLSSFVRFAQSGSVFPRASQCRRRRLRFTQPSPGHGSSSASSMESRSPGECPHSVR